MPFAKFLAETNRANFGITPEEFLEPKSVKAVFIWSGFLVEHCSLPSAAATFACARILVEQLLSVLVQSSCSCGGGGETGPNVCCTVARVIGLKARTSALWCCRNCDITRAAQSGRLAASLAVESALRSYLPRMPKTLDRYLRHD